MRPIITRRHFLVLAGGACLLGCGSAPTEVKKACVAPSDGPGLGYCLVENKVIRIPKGARMARGRVALCNVDDNSAAIVARDERGFYALSGICTHQCCLLTVCDGACSTVLTNPGSCATTPVGTLARTGAAFVCACHGSEFAADGTVLSGPATISLPAVQLHKDGDDLLVDLARVANPQDRVV